MGPQASCNDGLYSLMLGWVRLQFLEVNAHAALLSIWECFFRIGAAVLAIKALVAKMSIAPSMRTRSFRDLFWSSLDSFHGLIGVWVLQAIGQVANNRL